MFRFANSEILYVLFLFPVFILLFWYVLVKRKKVLQKYASSHLVEYLSPLASVAKKRTKFILWLLSFVCVILALARPQFGSKLEEVKREGIEVVIALDVSNSMLAEDIKPNRIERAKQAISKLVDRLQDDRIGLIVFAGDAFVQLPITADYVSAKMFLSTISTDIVPVQGTAIGKAIKTAARSFTPNTEANKIIIIITDGENHEDDAVAAAEEANKKGIKVYTIGMGSPSGAPIPINRNANSYRKDKQGNIVISRLDEETLNKIAVSGGGKYILANNTQIGLSALFEQINKINKTEFETKVYTEYEDRFQYLIGLALLLIIIDVFVLERKSVWLNKLNLFKTEMK